MICSQNLGGLKKQFFATRQNISLNKTGAFYGSKYVRSLLYIRRRKISVIKTNFRRKKRSLLFLFIFTKGGRVFIVVKVVTKGIFPQKRSKNVD